MFCSDIVAPFFLIFSNTVPQLLYYSHIPTSVIALLLGWFVFLRDKKELSAKILFTISILFSVWVFLSLIVWTNINSVLISFVWSFFGIITALLFLFSIYFTQVYITKKDVNLLTKLIWLILLLPLILFIKRSVSDFDMPNCEVIEDSLYTYYYYFIGLLSFVWILIFSFHKYFKTKIKEEKQQIFYLTFGMSAFLISFFIAGFFASYFDNFNLEQYGLFGMVVFIAYLAFLIVKFKAFDIKLIGSQALVWALIVLVGSEFFFVESLINQILVGATLIISSVSGLLIVRSVKREIALREHLEIANRNQESLIHFISHQLKGFFTKSKMIFSGIVEDDFGQTSYELKEAAKEGLLSDDNAVSMIQDILGASNLKKGTTTYNMKEIDFTQIVKKICSGFTKDVETKGLELKCNVPEIPMKILADSTQIDQVVKNLIDNSLKYTPKGSVEVSLGSEKKDGKDKVLLVIKDTGIGLSESDKNKLFTEGGKGDESLKVNVNSTGYGLYIVKKIVENHGGKIWAESDGRGMGSRFYVELGMIK